MPENAEALELYRKIKAFGSDMVFQLLDLAMSRLEAEEMLERMDLIESILSDIRASLNEH